MTPAAPGVYPLLTLTGIVVRRKVRRYGGGRLYAIMPGARWWHPSTAVPVASVPGTWILTTERRA